MTDALSYALDDGVAVIRIDDGKANVLSPAVLAGLHEHLDRAEADHAKALVIAGRPGQLTGGFDLKEFAKGPEATRDLVVAGARFINRVLVFPMPTVLAVTGNAIAAGAILAFATDWNVGAAGPFKIGLPETAIRMALPQFAVDLAAFRLDVRHVTRATLLAEMYDPEAALAAGYLDRVVPADEVVDAAIADAARFASSLSAGAVALSKQRARRLVHDKIEAEVDADVASLTTDLAAG